jgi:hypothetical protein
VPSLPDSASKLLEDACWAAKSIVAELNPQILTFLHPILNVQGHILTAGGIALRIALRTLSLLRGPKKKKNH